MRLVCATTGAFIVVLGAIAAITGEFAVHGGWLFALALAAVGVAGLLAAATGQTQ